jgi:hypothetical protein
MYTYHILESNLNEVVPEFLCDGGSLLRHDGVLVKADDESWNSVTRWVCEKNAQKQPVSFFVHLDT